MRCMVRTERGCHRPSVGVSHRCCTRVHEPLRTPRCMQRPRRRQRRQITTRRFLSRESWRRVDRFSHARRRLGYGRRWRCGRDRRQRPLGRRRRKDRRRYSRGVDEGLRYSDVGFLLRRPFDSAFRSFSWTISVSIFTSDSSSRSRWFSIRSCSRSWSPFLISSSSSTPRSIAALYLYSISSSDEVVFRACRS